MNFWKKILKICVFFPCSLLANLSFSHEVDVISGAITIQFEDHVVRGAVPIPIRRSYSSSIQSDEKKIFWRALQEMGLFSHVRMQVDRDGGRSPADQNYTAEIVEPGVGRIIYHERNSYHDKAYSGRRGYVEMIYQCTETSRWGNLDNMRQFPIEYTKNCRNHTIRFERKDKIAIMSLANGGKRFYKEVEGPVNDEYTPFYQNTKKHIGHKYQLYKEISPSGQITTYEYKNLCLRIQTLNHTQEKVLSSVTIKYNQRNKVFTLTCSDGTTIQYFGSELEKKPFLDRVEKEGCATQRLEYDRDDVQNMYWLHKFYSGDTCALEVDLALPKRHVVEEFPATIPKEYNWGWKEKKVVLRRL